MAAVALLFMEEDLVDPLWVDPLFIGVLELWPDGAVAA
jgi:hypothetical protein